MESGRKSKPSGSVPLGPPVTTDGVYETSGTIDNDGKIVDAGSAMVDVPLATPESANIVAGPDASLFSTETVGVMLPSSSKSRISKNQSNSEFLREAK